MGTRREHSGNSAGNKTRVREQFGWEQTRKTGGNSSRPVPTLVPASTHCRARRYGKVGTKFRVLIVSSPRSPLRASAPARRASRERRGTLTMHSCSQFPVSTLKGGFHMQDEVTERLDALVAEDIEVGRKMTKGQAGHRRARRRSGTKKAPMR